MDAMSAWPWQELVNNAATSFDIMKQEGLQNSAPIQEHAAQIICKSDTRKQVHLLMVIGQDDGLMLVLHIGCFQCWQLCIAITF